MITNNIEQRSVSVILPICDNLKTAKLRTSSGNLKNNVQNTQIDYESSIESICFSKPLISFTINSLKK